jgi:Leucine-rich repeat (LRR) protein
MQFALNPFAQGMRRSASTCKPLAEPHALGAQLLELRLQGFPELRRLPAAPNLSLRVLDLADCSLGVDEASLSAEDRLSRANAAPSTSFASGFWLLANLRELNLSGNRLAGLPEGVAGLGRLQRLDVSRNELQDLPAGLYLERLQWLGIRGNPLASWPLPSLEPAILGGLLVDRT